LPAKIAVSMPARTSNAPATTTNITRFEFGTINGCRSRADVAAIIAAPQAAQLAALAAQAAPQEEQQAIAGTYPGSAC